MEGIQENTVQGPVWLWDVKSPKVGKLKSASNAGKVLRPEKFIINNIAVCNASGIINTTFKNNA